MRITKVVITGGPCAGKTSAMSWIQNHFTKMGYVVLFIPETATELISGGVAPWTCGTNLDYQKCQVKLQLVKEDIFEQAALTMHADKVLIVCDRGFMDNKAYMNDEEFAEAVASVGGSYEEMRDRYDAVFHLVTAANGAEEYYTTANNAARYESVEEAVDLDNRLMRCWAGHPHFRVIDNSTGFEDKLKRLIKEMVSLLKEDHLIEYQRKFLIRYPDLDWLNSNPFARRVEVSEHYTFRQGDQEMRLRRCGTDGHYTYYQTSRRTFSGLRRAEVEKRLEKKRYLRILESLDPSVEQLEKVRYYLIYDRQYFSVDLYPFLDDVALVNVELAEEDQEIRFPPELEVIREVTEDPSYASYTLAQRYREFKES